VLQAVGWDAAADGLVGAPPIAVYVGEECHGSVLKALGVVGLGRGAKGKHVRLEAEFMYSNQRSGGHVSSCISRIHCPRGPTSSHTALNIHRTHYRISHSAQYRLHVRPLASTSSQSAVN